MHWRRRAARTASVDLEEAVDVAVRETRLDPIWRGNVRSLYLREDDNWRRCCGSFCEPCVLTLMAAVDRVRALVGPPRR